MDADIFQTPKIGNYQHAFAFHGVQELSFPLSPLIISLNTILDITKNSCKKRMKKIEYRCNRCLIIKERWIPNTQRPTPCTPCHKCGGLAALIAK